MISNYQLIISKAGDDKARTRKVYFRGTNRVVALIVEPNGKGLGFQAIVKRVNAAPHYTKVVKIMRDLKPIIGRQL